MCEREVGSLLSPNSQCRYVLVFLNLGLIQGGGNQAARLCEECQSLLDEMKRWVFQNTGIFHTLDREIEKREPEEFARELWPDLFAIIIKDQSSFNEGRLFAFLTCLTRAGMIWKVRGEDQKRIVRAHEELDHFLRTRLPNYDWTLFSRFLLRMQTPDREGCFPALCSFLRRLFAWKLLGETADARKSNTPRWLKTERYHQCESTPTS